MTNGMERFCKTDPKTYGIGYLDSKTFAADVQRVKDAGAEVVIAMPHWGQEYKRTPEPNTVALAKKLVAAGVDVVLGSHPHVVQPIQYVKATGADGKSRVGLVAYSLGNFISNMTDQYTDSGIILDFTLSEKAEGGFEVTNVGVVPLYCWNRDDMIQTLSSSKYDLKPPRGMSQKAVARMKQSRKELREILDERIPFLLE
jgi:poly-gamma-glutamate synthesis protein (capsule biosynthesis protein)